MSGIHDAAVDTFSSSSPPWWAQPRYAVGILGGIAAVLVWFLMTVVAQGQTKIHDLLQTHEAATSTIQRQQLDVLIQVCLNTAGHDHTAIARCQAVTR